MAKYGQMDEETRSRAGMVKGVCMDFKSKSIKYRAYLSLPKRGKALLYYGSDLETANRIAEAADEIKFYPLEYIEAREKKALEEIHRIQAIRQEYEQRMAMLAAEAAESKY